MIEIKNLNKYFNKGKKNEIHVINDTSLTLPDSGLVALLGESGCGKTTMLNAIGGLDDVKSGEIVINGQKITGSTIHKIDKIRNLSVGYIFQDYKLMDDMTVFDNVALALKMVGITDKAEVKLRVEYVLEKTGILRYRYRPASTLSGGERQRVGIARALVKNPDIILADEPTGNLDSANSVEVMNIIKTISKNRLVILVTHERKLAEFYATRVIELLDGKIAKDYENDHDNALDYELDNVVYLKEFEKHDSYENAGNEVNIYTNGKEKLNVNLIIKNGNIYIQSKMPVNIEVVDDSSSIEVVDDYKKVIDKESVSEYDFDMSKVGNQDIKKRHASIFNPITALTSGFKKVWSFSVLKKFLLVGFMLTGIFIIYEAGRIGSVIHVTDKDFVTYNKSYVEVEKPSLTVEEYEKLAANKNVKYALPTADDINLEFTFDDYYQTQYATNTLTGSLASSDMLKASDVIKGRLPETPKEIVIDKFTVETLLGRESTKMAGVFSMDDLIGRVGKLNNGMGYTVVGICNCSSPSVYAMPSEFITMLSYNNTGDRGDYESSDSEQLDTSSGLHNFALYKDKTKLEKGTWPENDYEIIVPNSQKDTYPLKKEIKTKVNGHKLKVVGYYTSDENSFMMCNENTIKQKMILESKAFLFSTNDKASVASDFKDQGYNAYDTYTDSKQKFDTQRSETVKTTLVFSGIIIGISLIEMFLISRSSFLSRIKEVGTLRAIGAKKTDIYKMFVGEIFAITTMTSLPAMLATYAAITAMAKEVALVSKLIYLDPTILLICIGITYLFNLLVGLLPVFNTMRKRPAAILARYDVD